MGINDVGKSCLAIPYFYCACPAVFLETMNQHRNRVWLNLMALLLPFSLWAQATGGQPDPHSVPVVDGGIGPCSADFVITDTSGSPVYAAKIDVHIAYGFMSVRKLDLEVSTNVDGKGRFTGLPNRVKSGLFFKASDPARSGDAFDDPSSTCKAQFTVVLRKAPQ